MDFCSENLDVEEKSIEFDKIRRMKRDYAIFSRWLPNASYVTGIGLSLITRNPTYLLISAAGEVFRFVEIKKGFIYRHLERRMASNRAQLMEDFFEDEEPIEIKPLDPIVEKIKELAERRRLNLPKSIYPLSLFQEALGIADTEVFTNILLVLAKGKIIELVPVFPCDIKQGMKVYQVPGLGKKKYYSFTISQ